MNWMITTNLVVWHAFVLTRILILVETFAQTITQRCKIFILHIRKLITMVSFTDICRGIITRFWSLRLIRFLGRTRHLQLRGISIFNLIHFCNQTFHTFDLVVCQLRIDSWHITLKLLGLVLFCLLLDLFNSFELIIKALELIYRICLHIDLCCDVFNHW